MTLHCIALPCSCFFLGQLRESRYPLNRAKKGDPMMKVRLRRLARHVHSCANTIFLA